MKFTQRARGIVQAIAVVLSLAYPLMLAVSPADARPGGGFSMGSRGSRTFSPPPSTSTAPGTAQPFNRTITQPSSPGLNSPIGGRGFFNSPGRSMLGGLAAGFLGAGLLGMLFGGGMFGGLGGFSSIFGLILQIVLIVFLVRMAMSWWQRRQAPAYAGATPASPGGPANFRSGMGFGLGSGSAPLQILPADYEAFERLLSEIQAAWSNEDIDRLHTLATPEMVSYLAQDIEANKARNVINKTSNVKLLQGDLAEAWREGDTDYASVAMRFSLVDKTLDRAGGRLVEGSEQPNEVTEVWTFVRPRGANWELSAIQQV
ncbi:Predicted lipid-binding transport protein, Tim44 family [Bradyrhizobium lablabi]|uniref:Predicted lipid-binding transport protein, Tim44 family n=1 Tax=Bradyrhizobium lablabi TaxID=722472 RepID=A0A1M7BU24_9BRAD|nr:TIM44-like domain-containing protein [Bradyrhizobium lablabi]SHL58528.1 Predicted lipid-binding transport protein, Tim44 family [Bradyrhizobium lablabi]